METRQQTVYTAAPADVPRDRKMASEDEATWAALVAQVMAPGRRLLDVRRGS